MSPEAASSAAGSSSAEFSSAASSSAESSFTGRYCGRCGRPINETAHEGCAAGLELEPPRYCQQCARRMVVQVLPTGWTARCSRHGSVDARLSGSGG